MTTGTYSTDKDIDRMVRDLRREGWSVDTTRRHNRIVSPRGTPLTVPKTPSDRRAYLNFAADVRRAKEKEKTCL